MTMRLPLIFLLILPVCAQVQFTQGKDRISIEIDGKPYADFFLAADGNKPYVYPLRTASGVVVTRHFPMEEFPGETHDHPHHRGMFFSHGDINGFNFWATEATSPNANSAKNAAASIDSPSRRASMRLKKVTQLKNGGKSGTI